MKLTKTQKKVIIGTSVGVLGATAIITPIVVTYINNQANWPFMVDDLDQKTGITVDTYNSMKEQLKKSYRQKLEEEWTSSEEIEHKLAKTDDAINGFDQEFQKNLDLAAKSTAETYDYTKLTTALANYARENCGITLDRKSNVTIADLQDEYDKLRSSNATYMENLGTLTSEQIEARLREADKQYNQIEQELVAKYPNDDVAVLSEGTERILECFEAENAEIAALSAQMKLKQFRENYTIAYKKYNPASNATPNYYSSDLIQNKLQINQKIHNTDMNTIFSFTSKSLGKEIEFKSTTAIPGYIVEPVLKEKYIDDMSKKNIEAIQKAEGNTTNEEIKQDATDYTNKYALGIDWTVTSQRYLAAHPNISNAEIEDITAHHIGELKTNDLSDDASFIEVNKTGEIEIVSEPIGEGIDETKNRLANSYFNGVDEHGKAIDKIEFRFDGTDLQKAYDNYKLEKLLGNLSKDSNGIQEIFRHNMENLSEAGVEVRQIHVTTNKDPITGKVTSSKEESPWLYFSYFMKHLPDLQDKDDLDVRNNTTMEIKGKDYHVGLIYSFARNCELEAKMDFDDVPKTKKVMVKGKETEVAMFEIKNTQLLARYKETPDEEGNLLEVGDKFDFFAPLSDEYFKECADKYNKVRDQYSIYIDEENALTEIDKQDTHFWILSAFTIAKASVDLALLLVRYYHHLPTMTEETTTLDPNDATSSVPFTHKLDVMNSLEIESKTTYTMKKVLQENGQEYVSITESKPRLMTPTEKKKFIVAIACTILNLAFDMTMWGIFITKPINEIVAKVNKFKSQHKDDITAVRDFLNSYKDVYPILKDGKTLEYDEDEFNTKHIEFSKKLEGKTFTEFNAEYNAKWDNIETSESIFKNLLILADDNGVGIKALSKALDGFDYSNTLSDIIFSVGLVVSFINFLALWNQPGKLQWMFKADFIASIIINICSMITSRILEKFEKSYKRVDARIFELQADLFEKETEEKLVA